MNTTVTARKHSHQIPTTQRTLPIFKTTRVSLIEQNGRA
jgi:hypothetical protein